MLTFSNIAKTVFQLNSAFSQQEIIELINTAPYDVRPVAIALFECAKHLLG